jgi:hypothetical protein
VYWNIKQGVRGVMNLWFGFLIFGHGNGVIFGVFALFCNDW